MANGRQALYDALRTFTFSLSQGLAAQSQAPGRRGSQMGMAAALGAPAVMQDMETKRLQAAQESALKQRQIEEMIRAGRVDEAVALLKVNPRAAEAQLPNYTETAPFPGQSVPPPVQQGGTFEAPLPPIPVPLASGTINMPQTSQQQMGRDALAKVFGQQQAEAMFRAPQAQPRNFASSPSGIFSTATGEVKTPAPTPLPRALTGSPAEYEYAKSQGYKGTFQQYQDEDANRKKVTNTFNMNNPKQDEAVVKYMADQVQDNPLNWNLTAGNKVLQDQVRQELATREKGVNRLTAATRQLGETATVIVPKIDATIKKLDDPKFVANLGPVMGRWNEFLTGKVGTNDPDLAQLRATMALIQTGTMRAHVGARGGSGMLEKFEGLVDGSKMDGATLKGSLTGIRDFLKGYADEVRASGTLPPGTPTPSDPMGTGGAPLTAPPNGKVIKYDNKGNRIP